MNARITFTIEVFKLEDYSYVELLKRYYHSVAYARENNFLALYTCSSKDELDLTHTPEQEIDSDRIILNTANMDERLPDSVIYPVTLDMVWVEDSDEAG